MHLLNRWTWSDERIEHKMSLRVANLLPVPGIGTVECVEEDEREKGGKAFLYSHFLPPTPLLIFLLMCHPHNFNAWNRLTIYLLLIQLKSN